MFLDIVDRCTALEEESGRVRYAFEAKEIFLREQLTAAETERAGFVVHGSVVTELLESIVDGVVAERVVRGRVHITI